jgi:hypothetical protein
MILKYWHTSAEADKSDTSQAKNHSHYLIHHHPRFAKKMHVLLTLNHWSKQILNREGGP